MIKVQILQDLSGRYSARLPASQDDPLLCIGYGRLREFTEEEWAHINELQRAEQELQERLREPSCTRTKGDTSA